MLAYTTKDEEVIRLCEAMVSVTTPEQALALLEDLCTVAEIADFAQRFEIALLLDAGGTYHTIQTKTDASPTTISRVSKVLNHGAGGYRHAIDTIAKLHPTSGKKSDGVKKA